MPSIARRFVALTIGLIPLLNAAAATAAEEAAKPNILFILSDDLGYGDLGCYGQKLIQTPHLDRMAREGMRFTDFYAGATVCAPSRSVLMTGQHTGHTRVRGNAPRTNRAPQTLLPEDVTVAERLHDLGYRTSLVGKWGLGDVGDTGHPNRQGFDEFFGFLDQQHAHNHFPDHLWRGETRVALKNVIVPIGDSGAGYATTRVEFAGDRFAAEALKFIDANSQRPFFLYLALTVPHANNERTRKLKDGQEVPDYGPYADRDWSNPLKGQAAMITRMDADIGRLLDRVKELGIDDSTLVLFSSDNGPHKEGGQDPVFFDPNGPVRGYKRDLTDGGVRVPLIARWPGRIPAGKESQFAGYFGDLYPTFVEVAGGKPPQDLDGISIVPELLGHSAQQKQHEYLYWEFYEGGSSQAVRFGDWKVIRKPFGTGPVQVYNLASDIGEEHDLAEDQPEIAARGVKYMDEAHVTSPLWPVPKPKNAGRSSK